jgi:Mg-chelatase subunit ChlD
MRFLASVLVLLATQSTAWTQDKPATHSAAHPAARATNRAKPVPATATRAEPTATPVAQTADQAEDAEPAFKPGDSSLAHDAKYSGKIQDVNALQAEASALIEVDQKDLEVEPPPRVEIIVDSSGSMGQALNMDRTRMYYMKKMLTRYFTDQFKQKAQTGLRVYGSRRKGDCEDNELMVPFNEKSLSRIELRVAKLGPVGKTPLYKAVKAAAEDLKSYKGPKAMVVFTDGEDTCGGNPCKEGKAAKDDPLLNTQIFIVAIGFKPDSKDLKKVSCLGDTTTANSEEELFSALGGISQKIFKNQINLHVNSPDPTAEVQLFQKVDGEFKYLRNFTSAFGTAVPPGEYQAVVMLQPRYKFDTFKIPPKRAVTLTVKGTGTVNIEFLNKILDVDVLDKNMKSIMKFKSDTPTQVPTGRWTLKMSKAPFYENFVQKFEVVPNGKYNYKVTGAGALKVKTADLTGFYVYDNKKNLLGNYLSNYPFALPMGDYSIHVNDKCSFDKITAKDDHKLMELTCK